MDRTLVILIGIQGSGKSTFFQRFLSTDYEKVNLDTLKTRKREMRLVEEYIAHGVSFAVDNTNPTTEDRARYILPAKTEGYQVIGFFLESKLQACIERNNRRTGKEKLPAAAIASTSNRLQFPSYREGFDELYFVSNDGEKMTISQWRKNE